MKTNLTSNLILILIPVFGLSWAGCSSPKPEELKTQSAAHAHVSTFILTKGDLQTELKIPAELTAYKQVDLYAKVNSYVKYLYADVGSPVKKGQLLATLEAPELNAQLSSAESKYKAQEAIFNVSEATYQRILETSKTPGTVSKNDVDIAAAKRNSDKAQLDAAKADYNSNNTITQYLIIRAPFDGVISARNVNLGAYIGPSGKGSELPIFTLHELRKLRLVVEIPEADKSYIKLNDQVSFSVKAFPGKVFIGKIVRRSGVMDSQLRSEHIELDVSNDDLKLSPGMVAEATIKLSGGSGDAFIVPKSAVLNSTDGIFMIQDLNDKAKKINIKLGRSTDSLVEVFGSNLQSGTTFVKGASEDMRDGKDL
jgi:membrane fusion protein (multidrug efflux system)